MSPTGLLPVPDGGGFGPDVDQVVRTVAVRLDSGATASAEGGGLALPRHRIPGRREDLEVAADRYRAIGAEDK